MNTTLSLLGLLAIVIGAVAAVLFRRHQKRAPSKTDVGRTGFHQSQARVEPDQGKEVETTSLAPATARSEMVGLPLVAMQNSRNEFTSEELSRSEVSAGADVAVEEKPLPADVKDARNELGRGIIQEVSATAEIENGRLTNTNLEQDTAVTNRQDVLDCAADEVARGQAIQRVAELEDEEESATSDVVTVPEKREENDASPDGTDVTTSADGEESDEPTAHPVRSRHQRLGTPRKYRPPRRLQPTGRAERSESGSEAAQLHSLGIDVRLIVQPGGFCRVCLLPRRMPDLPTQIEVTSFDGDLVELTALQDEWYEDLVLPKMGDRLRSGISWEWRDGEGRQTRWSLSGHEIYVLGRHEELSGFVSRPRLILGERQAVICTSEHREEVIRAITAAGSPSPEILDDQNGMVPGWLALLGIVPRQAIMPSASGEILDVLRPLPDVQIVFDGGVRVGRAAWLCGHPPAIRVLGSITEVTFKIDGKDVAIAPNEALTAPGWDEVGQHNVWCISQARSYEIRDGLEEWDCWEAYAWSLGDVSPIKDLAVGAICGALVTSAREVLGSPPSIIVPATNSVLLGQVPGEIYHCRVHSEGPVGVAIGFPSFDPVWAVPANPLHCDRKSNRVLLLGPTRPAEALAKISRDLHRKNFRSDEQKRIREWYTCVLEVSRKRIPLGCESLQRLWFSYKREANRIRRAWK